MTVTAAAPDRLHFTGDDEANRLLVEDPLALLIGFALDQQVPVQKAFSGPMELKRRIGHLDPRRIAAMDAEQLADVFRQRLALHRYPAAMAGRVQALCAYVVSGVRRPGGAVWTEARDGRDLRARLHGAAVLRRDEGALACSRSCPSGIALRLPGLDEVAPKHPTLGDVDSPEALEEYQAAKRALQGVDARRPRPARQR